MKTIYSKQFNETVNNKAYFLTRNVGESASQIVFMMVLTVRHIPANVQITLTEEK